MKCPYCDVEMIPGFLNCGNTIWSERKHKISTLPGGKESMPCIWKCRCYHPTILKATAARNARRSLSTHLTMRITSIDWRISIETTTVEI